MVGVGGGFGAGGEGGSVSLRFLLPFLKGPDAST